MRARFVLLFFVLSLFGANELRACCELYYDVGCECDAAGHCEIVASPLVINLTGGAWDLTGVNDPVRFDIRAIGRKDTVGWTARESNVVFVARDVNGNGRIDDGSELFGDATQMPDGTRADHGFTALARYDSNNDGLIDAADFVWSSLLLWRDRNHDGESAADELSPISASAVTTINLSYQWQGRRDRHGNQFRYRARVATNGGSRDIYDVFFVTAPAQ